MIRLDEAGLGRCIDAHFHRPGDRLFRMEVLPRYAVATDGDDYRRWRAGATEPTWARKGPWLATLRRERDNGQVSTRVRVLSAQVTDYERFACAFGYAHNVEAGEDIRVLHRGEHPLPEALIDQDYWLINDDVLITMVYDQDGAFVRAELDPGTDPQPYRRSRDAAWAAAEPFPTWWRRHPDLHRRAPVDTDAPNR